MKYVVTGGAGFIGNHLTRALLESGHDVVVVDNLATGKREKIEDLRENDHFTFHEMSITDDLGGVFGREKPDGVFHMAAYTNVQFSVENPIEAHETNINGTLNVLQAAKEAGVKRVVFSTSCSVYGDTSDQALTEDLKPNPLSPYALHKLVGEYYCEQYNRIYGLETVALRYFNVFGPGQPPDAAYAAVIPKFADMILRGQAPVINGDGEQTRDFVYVGDIVRANILAMESGNASILGDVINIGTEEAKSVNEITDVLIQLASSDLEPSHGPAVVESRHALADASKAKKQLGWEPEISFEDGMKSTFRYIQDQQEA